MQNRPAFDPALAEWYLKQEDYGAVGARMKELELGSWLTEATVEVSVSFMTYNAHFDGGLLERVAIGMNRRWASAVARWMRAGSLFLRGGPQSARLRGSLGGKTDQVLANWFLDALTIHRSDVDRVNAVLSQ